MLIWKLQFMICTLCTLSDAINNSYSLTKSLQLFRHQYKIKCERLFHKKSDWNYYYLHIKFTRLYFINLHLSVCVLRMSNPCEIIIRIIIYNFHVIQLWMPSDVVPALYTSTLHVCGVFLEPAWCQELWHSNYVLFHELGFITYDLVSIRTLHVPAFAVSEVSQIMRCDTKSLLVKWFGRHN